VAEAKWINAADVAQYRFPEANQSLIHQIARGSVRL
jgi:hypothetical protein